MKTEEEIVELSDRIKCLWCHGVSTVMELNSGFYDPEQKRNLYGRDLALDKQLQDRQVIYRCRREDRILAREIEGQIVLFPERARKHTHGAPRLPRLS